MMVPVSDLYQEPPNSRTSYLPSYRFMPQVEHAAFIGTTRYGKSEKCLSLNCPRFKKHAVVMFDPPGTMAEKAAIYAIHNGMGHRLIYDEIHKTRGVPGYPFLVPSTDPDPEIRMAENRERVAEAKAILVKAEGKLNTAGNPIINEGLEVALNVFINQDTPIPFYFIREVFTKESEAHQYLIKHLTDPETLFKLTYMVNLPLRDWEQKCGPAARRLENLCGSIHFKKRCIPTFDFAKFLNAGGIWIGNGASRGGLSREDLSSIFGMILLQIIQLVRSGQLTRRVIVIIDEGQFDLIDLNVARALAESAKWGLEFQLIVQNPLGFSDKRIQDAIFQNCATQYFFHQVNAEATTFAARMIGTAQYDPDLVHRVIERIGLVDDGYETIDTTSTNESVDEHGAKRKGTSHGQTFRARPKKEEIERTEELYKFDEQIHLFEHKITNLDVGQFMLRSGQYVSPNAEYSPMLKLPYEGPRGPLMYSRTQTLALKKLEMALEEFRVQRPEYQTPPLRTPLCPPKKARKTVME